MKAGTIFTVTSGEYSDFGIVATLRALRDFDFDAEMGRARDAVQDKDDRGSSYVGEYMPMLQWLENAGFIEHVYLPEVYLGAYGRYESGGAARALAFKSTVPLCSWARSCLEHEDCRAHPELGAACATRLACEPKEPK